MRITAYGHPHILATHPTTIEVTTGEHLSKRGDCIVGVKASHSLSDLREKLYELRDSHITVSFSVDSVREEVAGFVHPALEFTDTKAIILRKSAFLCPRTLAIHSNKAAKDLNRELIEKMKNSEQEMIIEIRKIDEYMRYEL
jgi:hypothetical protein